MAPRPRLEIWTEASATIGYGHFQRSLSVREYALRAQLDVHFRLWGNPPPWFQHEFEILGEADFALAAAELQTSDLLWIDRFSLCQEQVDWLEKNLKCTILWVDDFPRRKYQTSFVLDWTPKNSLMPAISSDHNPRSMRGLEYCVLPPLLTAKLPMTRPSPQNRAALWATPSLGDQAFAALAEIAHLLQKGGSEVILVGKRWDKSEFKSFEVLEYYDLQTLVNLVPRLDYALLGGGQSLYELQAMGLPCYALPWVKDQEEDVSGFSEYGLCHACSTQWDQPWNVQQILADLNSYPAPFDAKRAPPLDGKGMHRILERLGLL